MSVPGDEAARHQTAKLGVHRMQRGLRRVRKFGDGENHLPVQLSLLGKEVLPLESLHDGQTRASKSSAELRTVLPPPPAFICWATAVSICSSMTF
jgi:hypothetical protein